MRCIEGTAIHSVKRGVRHPIDVAKGFNSVSIIVYACALNARLKVNGLIIPSKTSCKAAVVQRLAFTKYSIRAQAFKIKDIDIPSCLG